MLKKFQYTTDEEKQTVLQENSTLILVEEQNISEGNYLIFAESLEDIRVVPTPIEDRLTNIEDTQDLILLKLEGVIV